jgi:hypothetical protein
VLARHADFRWRAFSFASAISITSAIFDGAFVARFAAFSWHLQLFGDNRQLFDELLVWSTRKSS